MNIKWIGFLFFLSGASAIIYQIVWQRILFSYFGSNIESVTIIVSIFMFGLGLGSILGGRISRYFHDKLLFIFLLLEVFIGTFGIFSAALIKYVSDLTVGISNASLVLAIYLLIALPTLCMGATLPILVAYLFEKQSLARIVSHLYFSNTLGSAIFCLLTVVVIFKIFGLRDSIMIAASLNYLTGVLIYWLCYKNKQVIE